MTASPAQPGPAYKVVYDYELSRELNPWKSLSVATRYAKHVAGVNNVNSAADRRLTVLLPQLLPRALLPAPPFAREQKPEGAARRLKSTGRFGWFCSFNKRCEIP